MSQKFHFNQFPALNLKNLVKRKGVPNFSNLGQEQGSNLFSQTFHISEGKGMGNILKVLSKCNLIPEMKFL